jgi:hypothetical protein
VPGLVLPEQAHAIEPGVPVRFFVEFHHRHEVAA